MAWKTLEHVSHGVYELCYERYELSKEHIMLQLREFRKDGSNISFCSALVYPDELLRALRSENTSEIITHFQLPPFEPTPDVCLCVSRCTGGYELQILLLPRYGENVPKKPAFFPTEKLDFIVRDIEGSREQLEFKF